MYEELDPVEELKSLIHEAVEEATRNSTNPLRDPAAPAFERIAPQTYFRELLAEVLTTTDALYILEGLVFGDDE